MSLLEERILRIFELRTAGADTDTITRQLGLDASLVNIYEKFAKNAIKAVSLRGVLHLDELVSMTGLPAEVVKMFQKRRNHHPKNVRYEAIRRAVEGGAGSVDAIAEQVGLAKRTVLIYANEANIRLPRKMRSLNERYEAIRRAVEGGAGSVDAIAEQVGLAPKTVYCYASEANIRLPGQRCPGPRRWSEIYSLVESGFTLEKIGNAVGVTRERIRQYLIATGQHGYWKQKRLEVTQAPKIEAQQRKQLLEELVSLLKARILEPATGELWPYQKAAEYFVIKRRRARSVEDIVELFKKYQAGKESGRKVSLEELGSHLGIAAPQPEVGRILQEVGLEPMYWKVHNRTIIPPEKKQALEAAFAMNLSDADIAHFLGLPYYVVWGTFSRIGRRNNPIKFIEGTKITYRLASQIYEAMDAGFNRGDTAELIGKSKKTVDDVGELRAELAPKIVGALRVLYPDRNIDKPYIG